MKRYIHVNQHAIKRNQKTGGRDPVITCKCYKSNDYCCEVEILGPCRVVYRPDRPLPCGATVWIETDADVILHEQCQPAEAQLEKKRQDVPR